MRRYSMAAKRGQMDMDGYYRPARPAVETEHPIRERTGNNLASGYEVPIGGENSTIINTGIDVLISVIFLVCAIWILVSWGTDETFRKEVIIVLAITAIVHVVLNSFKYF